MRAWEFLDAAGRSRISRRLLAPILTILAIGLAPAAHAAPGLDLSPYRGKVVYIDFWASWCDPCRQSFPWMESVQSSYGAQGFVVLAVNVDHDHAAAEKFLQAHATNFKIVFDPKGEIASSYKIKGMPMSILVGRDGQVRFNHVGFYENKEDAYAYQISQLVAERAH